MSKVLDKNLAKNLANVFLRPKPNGNFRLILDLSSLNDEVIKKHFKMTHLNTAIEMISEGCFLFLRVL